MVINNIIKSHTHLAEIIKKYSRDIFEIPLSNNLINFIVNMCIFNNKNKFIKNKLLIDSFFIVFVENFKIKYINLDKKIDSGTYGNIYNVLENDDIIVKVIKEGKDEIFNIKELHKSEAIISFTNEFITYISWISILKYIKYEHPKYYCNQIKDIVNIKKPFIKIIEKDNKIYYKFGYFIEKYVISMSDMMYNYNNSQTKSILTNIKNVIISLYNFNRISRLGINICHRDTTTNNIMLDKNNHVKFIDFGFSLISINMLNGCRWSFGYYFNEKYRYKVNNHCDIIIFLLYMIYFNDQILKDTKIYKKILVLLDYTNNKKYINNETDSIWLFPYRANIDTEFFFTLAKNIINEKIDKY
jgi:serine/threonine protein kinase